MKKVQLPLDHLADLWPDDCRRARVGALLHPASVSSSLKHASQILEELNGRVLRLAAFFGPQHGFLGQTQDNMIEWASYSDPRLGIPVHSLYGETREPSAEMLENLDLFLIDLQDVALATTLLSGRWSSACGPVRAKGCRSWSWIGPIRSTA